MARFFSNLFFGFVSILVALACVAFVVLACFAASSANAAYSTLASASSSLSSYGFSFNGVIVGSRTITSPSSGRSYVVIGAVTNDGKYKLLVSYRSNNYYPSTDVHVGYSSSALMPSSFYAWKDLYGNGNGYIDISSATPYVYVFAGETSRSAYYMIHFPTVPSGSALIDVSQSLDAKGTASIIAGASSGGKVYTQVRVDGEWKTVQIQSAPSVNTSYTYSTADVESWLGYTVGVDAIRAVTYTSAGVYSYSSQSLFSGSGAYVWNTPDNIVSSVTLPTEAVTFLSPQQEGTLSYGADGTLTYGASGTGVLTSNSSTVSVVGTATDTLTAANTQTGVLRQNLAATASTNSTLLDIAADVDTIADNSDSSEGASADGGLSDADSALLENIDKNIQDAADRQAAFDEMTGYDREDSMADIIADARDALVSAVSGAQDEAASALSSKDLAGSDKSAGYTSPSGSSNFWQINLPWGAQLKFDPASVSEIATILYAVRAALGWIFLGLFYQWFVPRLREAYQTVILTPTPVANTNPAGLVGSVTNATKVVIWVAVLVSIPSLVSGILDTSSAISGFTGMVSWRDTNPIQEVSTASTPLGAAVKLVGCVFPVATVLNLFVLYVTAELFMTTFVYLMIFANKHITSY